MAGFHSQACQSVLEAYSLISETPSKMLRGMTSKVDNLFLCCAGVNRRLVNGLQTLEQCSRNSLLRLVNRQYESRETSRACFCFDFGSLPVKVLLQQLTGQPLQICYKVCHQILVAI
jgi:hypothetical protein